MNIKSRRLPVGYQEVEYVRADGSSWINTGYLANTSSKFVCYGRFTAYKDNAFIYGSTIDTFTKRIGWGEYDNKFMWNLGTWNYTDVEQDTNLHLFINDIANAKSYLDNSAFNASQPASEYEGTVLLFSRNRSFSISGSAAYAEIYYFKVYESDVLVRDLVPCYRLSDSVIGMYDIVNDVFYTNSGTGTFSKGADVVTVDSITIPEGSVKRITDGSGTIIWEAV